MMRVERVEKADWNKLAEDAHLICFQEKRPAHLNTFDFAIVPLDEKTIYGYATIIEMDAETAYMQHGGSMPNIKGTVSTKRCYHEMIDWLKARYKRISTRIENKNVAMLKLAMSEGLIIHGCDCYADGIFLHLSYGF